MAQETRVLLEHLGTPDLLTVNGYRGTGGYKSLEKALKELSPEQVTEEVKTSGLQGRGGAAFPTGMKWSFIPKNSNKPVYLACNADESEPGTCKDRVIIDENPHVLLEGILIACYAIGSHKAYIYIRGEFHRGAQILSMAIEDARREGLIGENIFGSGFDCDIEVYRGAGAYICGEETGLLTSLEGQKGYPRNKPPFPAISGLYDSPTIINNVETLAAVPVIVEKGGEWFKSMGTAKSTGTKLLCISGHVNKPGVYEVVLGEMTLREFIMDFGGGIPGGKKIKGVIPGGSSMPVMRDEELDVKLTFEDIHQAGSSLGSGAIIVMDETVDMVEMALLLAKFYEHESCGQCTPCREGTRWFVQILDAMMKGEGHPDDLDLLHDIFRSEFTSICPLWVAAVWPVRAFIKQFREEFEEKIRKGKFGEKPDASVALAG
ncbi:MAG: NADH-quinone oxidoreductase subunit NuoF [Candidatus Hinthialibacter antarcticus]|nr:NADH-quinone oxidoreductase subunit NuoF [Candidatus Hinthialibacter antarcticus]